MRRLMGEIPSDASESSLSSKEVWLMAVVGRGRRMNSRLSDVYAGGGDSIDESW